MSEPVINDRDAARERALPAAEAVPGAEAVAGAGAGAAAVPAHVPAPARGAVARLRAVRRVRRGRGDRLSAGDVSYRIYLAVMLGIIVVAPIVRTGVLAAAPVVPGIGVSAAPMLAAGFTVLTAGAVLLGSKGGPARAGLPQLDLLFTAAIPRSLLLVSAVLRWLGSAALLGAVIGGMFAVALALGLPAAQVPQLTVAAGFALAGAGACLGIIVGGAQLVGQIGLRARSGVALALAALAAAQLAFGALWDPWSGAARLVVQAAGGVALDPAPLGVLAAAAGVIIVCALPIAARLDRDVLRAQAATWDSAKTFAVSGDPTAALARFGTPVRTGRRLRLVGSPGVFAMIARRDLLGILRTPARSIAALLGIAAAGLAWGALLAEPRGLLSSALLGAVAVVCAAAALPALCRGIATAAAGAGSPPLLPLAPGSLILRHTVVPLALAVIVLGAGALVAAGALLGAAPWLAVATAPAVALAAVILRVAAALKGTIPLRLLAPVPTPAGDMSGLNVFIWAIDGPVVAALSGAVLGALWGGVAADGGVIAPILVSAAVLAALAGWAYSRLRPSLNAQITEE